MSTQYRVPVEETFSWQRPVINLTTSTPPGSPAKGDRYVVHATGTGAWAGHDNSIAWYDGTAWRFDVPQQDWTLKNKADNKEYYWNGTAWITSSPMQLEPAAVQGNLAAFDNAGQVQDSGVSTPTFDSGLGAILIQM